MPKNENDAQVRFADGFVVERDYVFMASQLVGLEEYEHSRIFGFRHGEWIAFDVEMIVWSVCAVQGRDRAFFCLGRDGRIDISIAGKRHTERLADAGVGGGKLGYVSQIRGIGHDLYVCGGSGQVYRREDGRWTHIDDGLLDRKGGVRSIDLFSIDGTSDKDIYVVGKNGMMCHFDGKAWTRLESPSPYDLNWIRCVAPTEVYVCGNNGCFFKGSLGGWQNFSRPDLNEEFWSVEVFQGTIYLAATSGIYAYDGEKVDQVVTKLRPSPDGYHLHAKDGVLWSFGNEHLCFFDGKRWTYVKHPDNP